MTCGLSMYFFFNDTATTEIYTLSLHDALPIFVPQSLETARSRRCAEPIRLDHTATRRSRAVPSSTQGPTRSESRSEEHTSELQSRQYLVCRLLLEKKNNLCSHTILADRL